ncbi:hypothetical protein U91I_01188 [alpha proteobacterium U9-1i]|nr:hypothetical protein U91I_01188 [alpha proteobacterium U9-1i]
MNFSLQFGKSPPMRFDALSYLCRLALIVGILAKCSGGHIGRYHPHNVRSKCQRDPQRERPNERAECFPTADFAINDTVQAKENGSGVRHQNPNGQPCARLISQRAKLAGLAL